MSTDVILIFALNSPFFFSCIWQRALVRYVFFVGGRLSYLLYFFNTVFFAFSYSFSLITPFLYAASRQKKVVGLESF